MTDTNDDTTEVEQITNEAVEEIMGDGETDPELADDTDRSLGELARMVEFDTEKAMQTPFGAMTEAELIDMIRPMLHDWVRTNPDQARQFLAVLHLAAGDLLSKHGDADPEEIVERLGD